jgi:hypothetical protein
MVEVVGEFLQVLPAPGEALPPSSKDHLETFVSTYFCVTAKHKWKLFANKLLR